MAEFYEGFTYEWDVSARLTIEGIKVPLKGPQNGWLTATLPSGEKFKARLPSRKKFKARSSSGKKFKARSNAIVREYIRRSGMLAARDREKRAHLIELRKGRSWWNCWRRDNPDIRPVLSGEKHLRHELKGSKAKDLI